MDSREGDSLLPLQNFLPKIDGSKITLAHLLQHRHSTGIRAMLLDPETGMTSYAGAALFGTTWVSSSTPTALLFTLPSADTDAPLCQPSASRPASLPYSPLSETFANADMMRCVRLSFIREVQFIFISAFVSPCAVLGLGWPGIGVCDIVPWISYIGTLLTARPVPSDDIQILQAVWMDTRAGHVDIDGDGGLWSGSFVLEGTCPGSVKAQLCNNSALIQFLSLRSLRCVALADFGDVPPWILMMLFGACEEVCLFDADLALGSEFTARTSHSPLTHLSLHGSISGGESFLAACASTLEILEIDITKPFQLPELPALKRLELKSQTDL
ncbi:hypothetical protein K438DRAFT_1994523 [Mycena galopus ATCC 62051]|nr:hypothetical protein K438DRAFT_1994523 [Mycena galopus ATCC 62051]